MLLCYIIKLHLLCFNWETQQKSLTVLTDLFNAFKTFFLITTLPYFPIHYSAILPFCKVQVFGSNCEICNAYKGLDVNELLLNTL